MRNTFLFAVALLCFCSSCQNAKVQPSHQEEDWLFEKKIRCAAIKAPLDKELNAIGEYIDRVIYSPRLNTCVYTTTHILRNSDGRPTSTQFSIYDALTSENLFSYNVDNAREQYEKKIAELLGNSH